MTTSKTKKKPAAKVGDHGMHGPVAPYETPRTPVRAFRAQYAQAMLPEHRGNPLIEALPQFASGWDLLKAIQKRPVCDDDERGLSANYRSTAVSRLRSFIRPLDLHVEVISKIVLMITAGYAEKNPLDPLFRREVVTFYRQPEGEEPVPLGPSPCPTAPSFALLGRSGLGKTLLVERTLAFLPQVVLHPEHGFAQIVHLKLECPPNGSVKQLMLGFVSKVDDLLGTDYAHTYRRLETDLLVIQVAKLAVWHHVGLIVLDEAQRILLAKKDSDYALAFLVYMTNTVRVPILMLGTTSSLPLLSGSFHQARRTGDHGTVIWDRMEDGGEGSAWHSLVTEMLELSWTRHPVRLTPELSEALYDETLGIHALLVRLFMLCQIEVIDEQVELPITPDLVREVARTKFKLLRKFLEAIKSGANTDNLERSYRAKLATIDERMEPSSGAEIVAPAQTASAEIRTKAIKALVDMAECDEAAAVLVVDSVTEGEMKLGQVVTAALRRLSEDVSVSVTRDELTKIAAQRAEKGANATAKTPIRKRNQR